MEIAYSIVSIGGVISLIILGFWVFIQLFKKKDFIISIHQDEFGNLLQK